MSSIDATIVATALPVIHASLRTTINWAGWTLTVYSLGMVIVLPVGVGVASLAPLYAEDRYHLAALSAGTLLAARGVGAIVIGAAAAMALRRTGYRLPLAAGFGVVAVGTAAMAISPRLGLSPYVWLSIGAALTGLGNGPANPASRNACLQVAPVLRMSERQAGQVEQGIALGRLGPVDHAGDLVTVGGEEVTKRRPARPSAPAARAYPPGLRRSTERRRR